MREIRIDNPLLNSMITDLSADYSPTQASPTQVSVRNNFPFAANDIGVFGNPTEELAESKKIDSISSTNILVIDSALNFSHSKTTPVYKTIWDTVSIEANYGSGFSEITKSGIQWDNKDNKTIYFDQNGTDSTSYRFRFYNSVTLTYSEYSNTLVGSGFTRFQMGYIIRQARITAGDRAGRALSTPELIRELNYAKYFIRAHNPKYWFWKVDGFQNNILIPSVSGGNVYSLASITDYATMSVVRCRYTLGNTDIIWNLDKKPDPELQQYTRNLVRPNYDFPRFYRLLPPDSNSANGYFEVENKVQNADRVNFYVDYYKNEASYVDVTSSTAIPIPEILEDYLIYRIYQARGNDQMAQTALERFTGPQGKKRTEDLIPLTGIALLDELDRQEKIAQGQPRVLWLYKGQKGIAHMYGSRRFYTPDYIRENFFDETETY